MLKIARQYTNTVLHKFGLELSSRHQSPKILDLSGKSCNPVEAYYLSKGNAFLMTIPLNKCFYFDFSGENNNNPFVMTLKAYKNGSCTCFLNSPLKNFYDTWQPKNPAHYDKDNKEVAPPWDFGLKRNINLAKARLKRKDFIKIKNELGITDKHIYGHICRGPVSEGFGEITFNRLIKIYNSIQKHGYNPYQMGSDHIRASFFVNGEDYRVTISSGKHRIAALQALSYESVPILFGPPKFPIIIRRDEVDYWPNVKAGYYTKEKALEVFDRRFKNEHPSYWCWSPNS